MRFQKTALALLTPLVFTNTSGAQESLADLLADPAVSLSRPADRDRVVAGITRIETDRRQNARARATLLGLPLRSVLPDGRIQEIADFDGDQPLYFSTENANAAISTGANLLRTAPYTLSGSGITIGVWDGGSARASHQEFGSRVTVLDASASIDHATHVGGTLAASGVVANARGMANAALLDSYDWNNDAAEMTSRGASAAGQAGKIQLSNHSYNYISGWNYVNNGSPTRVWEWYGSGTTSASIETDFGIYNSYARDSDSLAFAAPYYLIFRSAGNDRTDNPSAGQTVTLTPGGTSVVSYDAATHPAGDGNYRGGFETIGYNALAKNVITVGSATDAVTSGVRDPSVASVSSFSSWGPTDDGRIKPDIVANGDGLYSSLNGSNSAYGTYSGTSMATPNACGSAALLIEQYYSLFPGQAPRASTLKGLLIHTADDRGRAGPDYKFGWGMANVKSAADQILDHFNFPAKQRITENQLTSTVTSRNHTFVWDGTTPMRATLCWTDPAGTATTSSDLRTPRLVNNLNLKIIAPNGSEFLPYVMPFVGTWTQASMDTAASTGTNNTDNVEQVYIAMPPAAGTYQVVVSYSGTLTNNTQDYSLLISGSSAALPPPVLSSVTPNSAISGSSVTLDLTGISLSADTAVKLTGAGQRDIHATGVQMIGDTLRCQVDLTTAAAGLWNVVATNPNGQSSTLTAAFKVIGTFWRENFDATVTGWATESTTGSNIWALVTTQSHTPTKSWFAAGPSSATTTNLVSPPVSIPSGTTDIQLRFWHNYILQSQRDGGRLEFSIDNGAWFGMESSGSGVSFGSGGYNGTINSASSDFNTRAAWTGSSGGFVETVVNLTDTAKFAGKTLRLRWSLATNTGTASTGWYVDSISLRGSDTLVNLPPAITSAASSSSMETQVDPDTTVHQIIRATSSALSVSATDAAGESALTYTWSVISGPGTPVIFSANGNNAAKNTTATFPTTGDYQLSVAVRDSENLATSSSVNLRVLQTASGLVVSPTAASLTLGTTQTFSAIMLDQFSVAMNSQPPSFAWSANGGGTINSAGVFSATTPGGPHVITATSGSFSNTASVTVTLGNNWASWIFIHFSETEVTQGLAAENADPDADGLLNLAEYALGTNPRRINTAPFATCDETDLILTFKRPAGLPGISYIAESCDTLGTWSPVPLEITEQGDPETVRARVSHTVGDPSSRFMRLRFIRQ